MARPSHSPVRPGVLFAGIALLCSLPSMTALAGGMFLPARGARPLARAGSFVAGGDDLEALYYNPAGLAGTGHGSVLLDAGLVLQRVDYDRVDSGGNQQPRASDDNGIVPLPFIGVSWRPEKLGKRVTLAVGAFAPYTGIPRYREDGPQRYSITSLSGTLLLVTELAVSVRVTPNFYIGAGFQNMFISLSDKLVLSSCASQVNCAPEQPNFDAPTQAKASASFVPSGNVGLLFVSRFVRVGASVQLPYWVRASGTVNTRLPSDPQFTGAVVVGDRVDVSFNLPLVARAGIEVRPTKRWRFEVGFDYENWSTHDRITFTPRDVHIDHVIGIGTYALKPMYLDRSFNDTYSGHLGGEFDAIEKRLTVRAGYLFESSAVPDETLAVLTPDGNKHLLACGLALRLGKVRLDVSYGHFFQADRTVTTSRSLQLNPIQPSIAVPVGNGKYAVAADVLAVGMEGRF